MAVLIVSCFPAIAMLPLQLPRLFFVAILILCASTAFANGPRALPNGEQPNDRRLSPLKDLNGYFPFEPHADAASWARRKAQLRVHTLTALGLWPMPSKGPLNAAVHSPIKKEDYTIEKVYFESFPGFYVTGNLYRPQGDSGKRPGVLCPHGHWSQGRFYDAGEARAKQQVEVGAEQDLEAARSPLQARCVQLARMGCVVFHYDMIGYADSQQISFEVAHRFAKQRPEMNSADRWGLFGPQAESHLQSVMGLQTFNSIRALDFLLSLDDVDPQRIAVTGASGGGTQTFILSAIDPRVQLAFPAVMVSTAMQGGCTCENCSLLRVGTGNVEFAAMFAPKPLGLTAADDWTKEMSTKGFPELQRHYEMLGAGENVSLLSRVEFKHNYNYVSRKAMYALVNKHFDLGLKTPIEERPFDRLSPEELTVWGPDHPQPEGGPDFERRLLQKWHEDSQQQLAASAPNDANELAEYRKVVGGAMDAIIGRRLPRAEDIEFEQTHKTRKEEWIEIAGLLRNTAENEELPIAFLYPKQWEGDVAIWLDAKGKQGLFEADGSPKPAVKKLVGRGVAVVGLDLFMQGEFLKPGETADKTRRVDNPREAAAYTFGYNHSLFARRVHDVLTAIAFVQSHEMNPERIHLVGLGEAGPWAAAARAQAGDAVDRVAIDTQGFRFAQVDDLHSPKFLPGGAKYFDLPGMLSLSAPAKLWIAGEGPQAPRIIAKVYAAADAESNLTVSKADTQQEKIDAAVEWLR